VVTYWEKWTDFEGAAMRDLVAYFNDTVGAEKGIYVDYVVTTQIHFKTPIAIAGGDPPDLVGLWLYNVSSFASRGALEELDACAQRAGIDEDVIIPVLYRGGRYHEHLYALPLTPWSVALYYNKDLFAEFAEELRAQGYSPDRPPQTLAELEAYADIVHRRGPDGEIELMAFLPGSPETVGWFWHTWALLFGGSFYDPVSGEIRVDSEPWVRGYEWVQDFAQRFHQRDVIRFEAGLANFNSPDNPFMAGKLAMVRQGPFFANMIRKYAPNINYGVAPFPTVDGSEVSFCEADMLAIPTGARHADEAWEFIEWLYTADPIIVSSKADEPRFGYESYTLQEESGLQRRSMPPLRPVEWLCWAHYKNGPLISPTRGFIETHPNPAIDVHERLARSPRAYTVPPLPNWAEFLSEFVAAYRDIWRGNVDVPSRLQECRQRVDVMIEQTKLRLARYGVEYP
jgi:ABC-type glycerol-3-phosphate transport system substrate-binding protein